MKGAKRLKLPLMMGGIEQELAMLAPHDEEYGGVWADEYQSSRYWSLFKGILAKHIESVSGIDFLDNSAFNKLLGSGGCLGLEGAYIAEISTPESIDALTAVNNLESLQRFVREAFMSSKESLPSEFIVSRTPAHLPLMRSGSERVAFRLGYHLNFNVALRADQLSEFATILAVLLPFLGASGGLAKEGFVLSPLGSTIKETLRFEQGLAGPPGIVEPRAYPAVLADRVDYAFEPRAHIPCFDAPLGKRSVFMGFALCQLLLSLILYEGSLLGKRLVNPALAYAYWSKCNLADFEHFERKFRLSDGSLVKHSDLLKLVALKLNEIRFQYSLHWTHEIALGELICGIRAWTEQDFWTLESRFDAFLKLRLYKEVLDTEGISFELFNNVAVSLVCMVCKLGPDLHTLTKLDEAELSELLATGGTEYKRKCLKWFMREHRLSVKDISIFARTVHRMQSLEIRLGEIFPNESPIAEHDKKSWKEFAENVDRPDTVPLNRSQKRGQLIKELTKTYDAKRLRADWSHVYYFRQDGDIEVITMPDPYRAVANSARLFRPDELSPHKEPFYFLEGLSFTQYLIDQNICSEEL